MQPQHFAREGADGSRSAPGRGGRRRPPAPGAPLLRRHLAVPDQVRRRPGAGPVVERAVEGDHRAGQGAAERRGEQRHQPAVLLEARRAAGAGRTPPRCRHSSAGYLRSDSVANRPSASAMTDTPSRAQAAASSRVSASTAARAAPVWAIAGMPWCGETVTLTIVPAGVAHRQLVGGLAHRQRAADVEPVDRVPALGRDPLGRNEVLPAGVVEQDVEPAHGDRARPGRSARRHRDSRMSPRPRSSARRSRPPPRSSTSARRPGDHHPRAAARELGGRRLPEVGAAAGDQRDLSLERAVANMRDGSSATPPAP